MSQVDSLINDAISRYRAGDLRGAVERASRAVELNPDEARARSVLGATLGRMGMFDASAMHLQRAADLAPTPGAWRDLATTLSRAGRYDEAVSALKRGLERFPGDDETVGFLAECLHATGNADDARAALDVFTRTRGLGPATAAALGLVSARAGDADEARRVLTQWSSDPRTPAHLRREMLFRLARLLDGAGRYDEAFEACVRANAEAARAPGAVVFDPDAHDRAVDELIRVWTPEATARVRAATNSGEGHLFIVGMPRSGTTLIEQILSCHPRAYGCQELLALLRMAQRLEGVTHPEMPAYFTHAERLNPQAAAQMGAAYRQGVRAMAPDSGARVFIDKRPDNFLHMALVGAILPGAKAIHMRREPLDVAISCFFQRMPATWPWSLSLAHIARYYAAYERLSAHWRAVNPVETLEIVYEKVVEDVEAAARQILDFAGLEFDERCLRFHESTRIVRTASDDQVRRPIYSSSIGRWRRYQKHLAPVRTVLEQSGVACAAP